MTFNGNGLQVCAYKVDFIAGFGWVQNLQCMMMHELCVYNSLCD